MKRYVLGVYREPRFFVHQHTLEDTEQSIFDIQSDTRLDICCQLRMTLTLLYANPGCLNLLERFSRIIRKSNIDLTASQIRQLCIIENIGHFRAARSALLARSTVLKARIEETTPRIGFGLTLINSFYCVAHVPGTEWTIEFFLNVFVDPS